MTTATLYCHDPECDGFDGVDVPWVPTRDTPYGHLAFQHCPTCDQALHDDPITTRVSLTLPDALRAINALLAAAAALDESTPNGARHRDAYRHAARRIRASYLLALAHTTKENA